MIHRLIDNITSITRGDFRDTVYGRINNPTYLRRYRSISRISSNRNRVLIVSCWNSDTYLNQPYTTFFCKKNPFPIRPIPSDLKWTFINNGITVCLSSKCGAIYRVCYKSWFPVIHIQVFIGSRCI